jgi:hypothetical protein
MALFGTIRNPLTVGASGQSDGSAYRALAESLAANSQQAGPSSGLNALQAILGPLSQVMNMNRAAEADQAFESRRMKEYEGFRTREADAERARKMAEGTATRAQREKDADQYGLTGLMRAKYVAEGEIPDSALAAPKQQGPIKVGRSLVDPVTFQPVYTDPAAPSQGRAPSRVEELQGLGATKEQILAAMLGGGGQQAPSGYRQTEGGTLEPIPGGPADQSARPQPIAPEVAARLSLTDEYLNNADTIREQIAGGTMTGPIDAATARAGYGQQGETRRQIMSGVDALRRGLTGAGMSQSEADDYVQRYLPAVQDTADSLLSKHDQLVKELSGYRANLQQGRGPAAAAPGTAPKRLKYNPATGDLE